MRKPPRQTRRHPQSRARHRTAGAVEPALGDLLAPEADRRDAGCDAPLDRLDRRTTSASCAGSATTGPAEDRPEPVSRTAQGVPTGRRARSFERPCHCQVGRQPARRELGVGKESRLIGQAEGLGEMNGAPRALESADHREPALVTGQPAEECDAGLVVEGGRAEEMARQRPPWVPAPRRTRRRRLDRAPAGQRTRQERSPRRSRAGRRFRACRRRGSGRT